MTDPPMLLKPNKRYSTLSSHHSPTRNRAGDDILAHLAPPTAAETLTSATGALRCCLDDATAAERDFAMRTALVSKSIWEWVIELGEWNWPVEGGSAGFEAPSGRPGKLSIRVLRPDGENDEYVGSVLAHDVAKYERRIDEIHRDLDELAVEDIKSHVLTNHILPMSRPSTPMTESSRISSMSSYNKLEDLTAVITTIVVQTLPNLAKLSRLLQVWSVRLGVLRRVPPFLYAIEDAEVGLESGWAAITEPPKGPSDMVEESPRLSLERKDFEIMQRVLSNKVAEPGRMLDYMLDRLEGMLDTLPDSWLDRIDAVEQNYSKWVAACESIMREGKGTTSAPWLPTAQTPTPQGSFENRDDSEPQPVGLPVVDADDATTLPVPLRTAEENETREGETGVAMHSGPAEPQLTGDEPPPTTKPENLAGAESTGCQRCSDGAKLASQLKLPNITVDDEPSRSDATKALAQTDCTNTKRASDHTIPSFCEEDEQQLPLLRASASQNSLTSQTSQTSTIVHETSSHFGTPSSDPPEVSTSPKLRQNCISGPNYVDDSPPSSPPTPDKASLESSVAPFDSPVVISTRGDESSAFYNGPADQSFVDDFDDTLSMSEVSSPMIRKDSSSDQQLRQQISEIIDSIPAKIKLSAEPSSVNLNPPDLQLPRLRKKPSKELLKRSASSLSAMSSRTTTPSFTLSPAKNARPRHHRGQQEIKVYHLSRSTGEPPIKLFIRCVGERGERVMVRVGGGWADLSEYLKEYASHHGRRSAGTAKASVEIRDAPRSSSGPLSACGSSPPRPTSSATEGSPMAPLHVRKTRRSVGSASSEASKLRPKTPAGARRTAENPPSSVESVRSSSSRISWVEDDSSFLGLAGPTGKKIEMSEENKAWVESVKEKVRLASGERRASGTEDRARLGDLGRVGATTRLFRKPEERSWR